MKEKIGATNALYPTPTTLVGAMVRGKPNFITIAHIGIMTHNYISLGMGKNHYTNSGIKENKTFSVCLPSEHLVVETDYCGIMSGKKTDKAALFDVFYGELKTAPMIQQCRVRMECRLDRIVDFPTYDVFIGEIIQTYADESILSDKNLDVSKLKPLLFDMNIGFGANFTSFEKIFCFRSHEKLHITFQLRRQPGRWGFEISF